MRLTAPPFLKPRDKVAIVAPAGKVDLSDLEVGSQVLASWGLEVELGSNTGRSHFKYSASESDRLSELQHYLDRSDIRAIMAVRGGYGSSSLIDDLDFTVFRQHPKWLVGFSDITALLLHTYQLGYQSIHGPMFKTLSLDEVSNHYLFKALFGESLGYIWDSSPLTEGEKL